MGRTPGQPRPQVRTGSPHREVWIDGLRVVVVVGVIGSHVSLIYALDVGWYYQERTASGIAKTILAGVFSPGLLFAMGLMFFVAGWFTPTALERKGARRFVVDRLWRLGVPTAAYLFVVNPAMNWFGDQAMGQGENVDDYFRFTYWDDVELGVAWFMLALLLFSLVYVTWRSRRPRQTDIVTTLRVGDLVKAGVFIAVASFIVRLRFPVLGGDELLTLNLWEYPQMAVLFALGILARERGWLSEALSPRLRVTCGRAAAIGAVLAALLGAGLALSEDAQPFLGGFRVEAALIPLIEATLAMGISLWLVDWFRRRRNEPRNLVRRFGGASFAAYLVHAPVTIALAIALRHFGVPAELKFLIVFGLGVVVSFGLGSLTTPIKLSGRIL